MRLTLLVLSAITLCGRQAHAAPATFICKNSNANFTWLGEATCPGVGGVLLSKLTAQIQGWRPSAVAGTISGNVTAETYEPGKGWMTRTWPIRAANVWFEGMNHEIRSETYLLSQASTGLTHFMVRSEQPEKWYEIRARHGIPFFCAGQFLHLDFQLQCEIRPSTDSLVE